MDIRSGNQISADNQLIRGIIAGMNFCRPGVIETFDPATQLASVTPAIMIKQVVGNEVNYLPLPVIEKVPLVIPFAQGQGLCLTIPIQPGDECLLLFSDRFMDNFIQQGGKVAPEACGCDNQMSEPRIHSLADAICIPGIISQPQKISAWSMDSMDLRNRSGDCFFRLFANGNIVIQTTGQVDIKADGKVNINGSEIHLNG